jgi:hypothetical protein
LVYDSPAGNKACHYVWTMPKDDLLSFMQTQEGSLLSFLTQAGTFKEEALDRDLQAVQAVYLERGFVNVKVGRPSVSLSPDKRYLYISIPVRRETSTPSPRSTSPGTSSTWGGRSAPGGEGFPQPAPEGIQPPAGGIAQLHV